MMKYKVAPWLIISHFTKKSLKKDYPQDEVELIIKNAANAYKNLLSQADDIGHKNPMASNLYMALAFFSFHVGNENLIKKDELKKIIDDFFANKMVYKFLGIIDFNKEKHFNKFKNKIRKNAKWIEARREKYPSSWDFDFTTNHTDGIYYRFTLCPIAKFFKEHNYEEYTPLFCAIDYINLGLMQADLYRKHTIAEEQGECDFWIVPNKIGQPK